MSRWIDSNLADRLYMVNHVSDSKDIDPESIEKDWWVTTVLKVLFDLSISEYMFFFIYGNPLDFDLLIRRLEELQARFRQMKG